MFQYKSTGTVSAARSVARRRGIGGRLRHLQTRHLWLQSRVALGHLKLDVVAGEESGRHARETIAGTRNPRMVGTCRSEMVAAITTTTNDGKHCEECMMTNILMD